MSGLYIPGVYQRRGCKCQGYIYLVYIRGGVANVRAIYIPGVYYRRGCKCQGYIYLVYIRGGVANVRVMYIYTWLYQRRGCKCQGYIYLECITGGIANVRVIYIPGCIRGGVANVRAIYTWCILEEGLQMLGTYTPGVHQRRGCKCQGQGWQTILHVLLGCWRRIWLGQVSCSLFSK